MSTNSKTAVCRPNLNILDDQNCLSINFGWSIKLTLPSITVSLDSMKDLNKESMIMPHNFESMRFSVPSGCLIVLVGKKFMHRLDTIFENVDHISRMHSLKVVGFFGEKTEVLPEVNTLNPPSMVIFIEILRLRL